MADIKVISAEDLKVLKDGDYLVGVILVQSYQKDTTKNGKPYMKGTLQSGGTIAFKCWDNSEAFVSLRDSDYNGVVALVSGTVQDYQGMLSVVVSSVVAVDGYRAVDFRVQRYDKDSIKKMFYSIISSRVSNKGITLLSKILTGDVEERYFEEFAASGHHDSCLSGLSAHVCKMLSIGDLVASLYPRLFTGDDSIATSDKVDLWYMSIALHDIGKIDEMNMGVYQPNSKVTHRILGLERLYEFKADFIEAYGESAFYDVVSVLVQHHDTFDDKARTVLAYAVYLVDVFESRFMGLVQEVESKVVDKGGNKQIYFDGRYLSL